MLASREGVTRAGGGFLTVGGEVGQQHADALHHLRVILVELVRLLDEGEAAAALLGHHHLQGRQLWAWARGWMG